MELLQKNRRVKLEMKSSNSGNTSYIYMSSAVQTTDTGSNGSYIYTSSTAQSTDTRVNMNAI